MEYIINKRIVICYFTQYLPFLGKFFDNYIYIAIFYFYSSLVIILWYLVSSLLLLNSSNTFISTSARFVYLCFSSWYIICKMFGGFSLISFRVFAVSIVWSSKKFCIYYSIWIFSLNAYLLFKKSSPKKLIQFDYIYCRDFLSFSTISRNLFFEALEAKLPASHELFGWPSLKELNEVPSAMLL